MPLGSNISSAYSWDSRPRDWSRVRTIFLVSISPNIASTLVVSWSLVEKWSRLSASWNWWWYLPCTFINFEKKNPPYMALFGSARLMFFNNFPTCTFILPYTSIRHTKIRILKVNYFHRLWKKKYLKLKSWLNFNAIIVFY